jgi:hypothetical protein
MFDFKKFLREGGIEKYLLEAQFGNDIDSRYEYIRPLMSRLPDSARTEAMIDGMEEARAEDDKMAFDFYFVETMKMLGLESELMEPDDAMSEPDYEDYAPDSALGPNPSFVEEGESLINPEAEEIEDDDLAAAADYFDSLAENDDVLDEILAEDVPLGIAPPFAIDDYVVFADDQLKGSPMRVIGMRKMFGSPLHAITVEKLNGETAEYDETQLAKMLSPEEKANVFVREEVEGEVQTEAMSDQLKINKLLQAANTIEDSLNDVNLELTDDQIDKFTEMILDLRAKAKASLKENEGQSVTPEQEKTYKQLKYLHGEVMNLLHRRIAIANRTGTELTKWRDQIEWGIKGGKFPDFWEDINLEDLLSDPDLKSEAGKGLNFFFREHAKDIKADAERAAGIFGTEKVGGKKLDATTQLLVKAYKVLASAAGNYMKAWNK